MSEETSYNASSEHESCQKWQNCKKYVKYNVLKIIIGCRSILSEIYIIKYYKYYDINKIFNFFVKISHA